MEGTTISWRSQKQTLVATSSNHAEIIALHEACRECVWLRSMTHHIQEASGMITSKEPTKLFEDNAACVAQLKEGYIKSDRNIFPHDFSRTLESSRRIKKWTSSTFAQVTMPQIYSPRRFLLQNSESMFKVLECDIYEICEEIITSIFQGEITSLYSFSLVMVFIPLGFSMIRFLTRQYVIRQ